MNFLYKNATSEKSLPISFVLEISHKFSTRNFLSSHSFTISGDAPRKMSPNKRDSLYVKGGVTWEEGERGGL